MSEIVMKGTKAADGIAIAEVLRMEPDHYDVPKKQDCDPELEKERLDRALRSALHDLRQLYERVLEKTGEEEAKIFESHQLILQDPEFIGQIKSEIDASRINAEWALQKVLDSLVAVFESMDDEYMRERAADMKDVCGRVTAYLLNVDYRSAFAYEKAVVVVARDLTPSDTAQLDQRYVTGFATDIGGRTSHSAIMARSLEIPAVVGLGDILSKVRNGDTIIVDGLEGKVIIRPETKTIREYEQRKQTYRQEREALRSLVGEKTATADGHTVELAVNIGTPDDVESALKNDAEGVGLFRSEFLYMNRQTLPDEEEQFAAYKTVASRMGEKPVIIRTLDVGGDKELPYLDLPQEMNPFLGYRAIRLCLEQTDLFRVQIRAVLRASHFGKVKMMFPMIATLSEFRRAKALVEEEKKKLDQDGIPYDREMEIGIMVEIPACALAAEHFAKEADFFSIGTNDLIQYTMACDRMNERIAHLYQPYHPSVLRLIHHVIEAAHAENKWVGMCGEMAGDRTAIPLLLGLGLDEFSMSASSILPARRFIRELEFESVKRLAQKALRCESEEQVRRLIEKTLKIM